MIFFSMLARTFTAVKTKMNPATSDLYLRGETLESLQGVAIKRMICTSDDDPALMAAVGAIRSIGNPTVIQDLFQDDEFRARLIDLAENAEKQGLQIYGRNGVVAAQARVGHIYSAFRHAVVFTISVASAQQINRLLFNFTQMELGTLFLDES